MLTLASQLNAELHHQRDNYTNLRLLQPPSVIRHQQARTDKLYSSMSTSCNCLDVTLHKNEKRDIAFRGLSKLVRLQVDYKLHFTTALMLNVIRRTFIVSSRHRERKCAENYNK